MFVILPRDSFASRVTNMPSYFSESNFCGSKSEKKVDFFLERKFFRGRFLRTQGMQFWNPAIKLDKSSKTFHWIFENNYLNNQFSQKTDLMRKRLQSRRLLAWQPCRKKLPQKSEKFPALKKVREWTVIETF